MKRWAKVIEETRWASVDKGTGGVDFIHPRTRGKAAIERDLSHHEKTKYRLVQVRITDAGGGNDD